MKIIESEFCDKKSARAFFENKRSNISTDSGKELSHLLCEQIVSLDEYIHADTVLLYFPTRSEPDLTPIVSDALARGKRIAFPISNIDSLTLSFYEVSSLDELTVGAYGIPEPSRLSDIVSTTEKTLCIVPALAVDKDGYRLGYGKGYYDRFLCGFDGASVCAIFSDLLCRSLPRLDTDIPVQIIVTERGAIRI